MQYKQKARPRFYQRGNPQKIVNPHSSNAANPVTTIVNNYAYDQRDRRITNQEQINGGTNVVLSRIDYNELGQVLTKHLHSETGAAPFLQDVGYTYNERGWLRTAGTPVNPFYMELRYDNPDVGISKQYNGNIAEMLYTGPISSSKTFSYRYDQLNRLTAALSTGNTLNETLNYDPMGNITALTRTGTSSAVLAYTYKNSGMSNQLATVTNSGSAFRSYPTYDNNGNAQSDGSTKNINYNLLNLPQTVTQAGTTLVTYTYTAAGEKLRSVSSGTDGSRDYIAGIEYHNNAIEYIETEEGRALLVSGSSYRYTYNLKDHLGNVRVTFDKNVTTQAMEVVQEDEYYSFGLRVSRQDNANNNHYLYNGKEVQADLAGQYDYGARFYDPVIARWNVIDPLAEKSRRFSTYSYADNNPIRNIDPDGMETADAFAQAEEAERQVQIRKQREQVETAKETAAQDANRAAELDGMTGHGNAPFAATPGSKNSTDNDENSGAVSDARWDKNFRQYLVIVIGESEKSGDDAAAIGSVMFNRMALKKVTFDDDDWLYKISVHHEGKTVDQDIHSSFNAYKTGDYAVLLAKSDAKFNKEGSKWSKRLAGGVLAYEGSKKGVDYSGGAYFWNATSQQYATDIGPNFRNVKNGTFTIIKDLGATTFMKYVNTKKHWP